MIPPPPVAVPSSGAKPTIRHVPPFPSVLLRRTKDPRIIMGRKEGKSMHFFLPIAGARRQIRRNMLAPNFPLFHLILFLNFRWIFL